MIEYEINEQFKKDVEAVVSDTKFTEFNALRELEVKIAAVVCTRTNNDDEHVPCKGTPITSKKLPPLFQLLTGFHYLVVGDYYFWTHTTDKRKNAAIHGALSSIHVERTKAGSISLKMIKPDIQAHSVTVARFGAYDEPLENCMEAFKRSANLLSSNLKPS